MKKEEAGFVFWFWQDTVHYKCVFLAKQFFSKKGFQCVSQLKIDAKFPLDPEITVCC